MKKEYFKRKKEENKTIFIFNHELLIRLILDVGFLAESIQ